MEYYRALDLIIQTVEHGYTFCTNVEDLHGFLLDPNNTPEELHEFIDHMRQMARRAHEDAKVMGEKFRGVGQNLTQVALFTTLLPHFEAEVLKITVGLPVHQVQAQEQEAGELTAIADRQSGESNLGIAIATATAGVITASIVAGGAFPPALLIFPVVIPIYGLISGKVSLHWSRQAESK